MSSNGGHEDELSDFCARLRRLRIEAGTPTLAWLACQPRCPGKSQLSKIFRGEVERVPDPDVIGGIVAACARRANEHGIRPVLPTDERQWEIERAVIERMLNHTSSSLPRPAAVEPVRVVPAQLPADVPAFTGRTRELAALDELSVGDSSAVIISAVSGTAGVGKTALALRWAHRVKHEFPDGQLYVNLRGYDPDQPVSPSDALAGFLRGLGLVGQNIPLDVDERAATYRSLLDGRRMLVVLDNAGSVEQVRPLLPGTSSCQVVVTSRDSLAGLVVGNGARRVDLDLLAHDEAVALLRTLLAERVDAEPAAATLLAEHCARLPLALRIATEYAAARPSTSLADVAAELADEQQRLDLLDAGDPRTAVRGVFSWSYRQLPAESSRVFRLLGLHPGADFDSYAAAALAGTDRATARRSLDVLARAHLVQPTGRDRYALHDLLRTYAAELAKTQDVPQEAVTHLFDHYVATTASAIDILYPEERHLRPKTQAETATPAQPFTDQAEARGWLASESNNLAATCAYTTDSDWPNYATQLSTVLWNYLNNMGQHAYAIAIHSHALRNSRRTGQRSAEARALTYLGHALFWHGDYQEAYEHVHLAVAIAREIDDLPCEADALTALGVFFRRQGHYRQAHEVFSKVLTIEDQIGRQQSAITVLLNLGLIHEQQDHDYQSSIAYHRKILALTRTTDSLTSQAQALNNLGFAYRRMGNYRRALKYHKYALSIANDTGGRTIILNSLFGIGLVHQSRNDYHQANKQFDELLTLARKVGARTTEPDALNCLGDVRLALEQLNEARLSHLEALQLATRLGDRHALGRAHYGLGNTYHAMGDGRQAREHWEAALEVFRDIEVPEADEVQGRLRES